MSNKRCLTVAVIITALCGWPAIGMAQFGGSPPTISPYVNMLRPDSSPALNYYGLVRPQQEFAMQNQQLGQGLQSLQMQGSNMQMNSSSFGYSQLGVTGHPVIFNSFGTSRFSGGYTGYGNSGGGGGGFGGGGFGGGGGGSFGGGGGGSFGGGGGGFGGGGFNQGGGGFGGGGFGGGGYGGGMGGGSQFGNQSNFGGIGTTGGGFGNVPSAFGGFSGHPAQFGGIGNTYRPGR